MGPTDGNCQIRIALYAGRDGAARVRTWAAGRLRDTVDGGSCRFGIEFSGCGE
jgi:hypothetical protein